MMKTNYFNKKQLRTLEVSSPLRAHKCKIPQLHISKNSGKLLLLFILKTLRKVIFPSIYSSQFEMNLSHRFRLNHFTGSFYTMTWIIKSHIWWYKKSFRPYNDHTKETYPSKSWNDHISDNFMIHEPQNRTPAARVMRKLWKTVN